MSVVMAVGLVQISHSGSRESRCSSGFVCPTRMVMDSVSDSKLWTEVGVIAGLTQGEPVVGLRRFVLDSDFFRFSPALANVWRSGDFAGEVLDRCNTFPDLVAPDSGDGARLGVVVGNNVSRGEPEGAGDVARRGSLKFEDKSCTSS